MSEESTKVSRNKGVWLKVVLVVLLVVLIVYGTFITVVNNNLTSQRDQRTKEDIALSQLPGQACGVLSPELAKATIGEPIKRTARNNQNVAYEDGCIYADPGNSNQFASLVIKTYPTKKQAADVFAKERSLRFDSENRDPGNYGDEMYYSAGSFFILRDNQTISVGTAKEGVDASQQEAFSMKLLDSVIQNI